MPSFVMWYKTIYLCTYIEKYYNRSISSKASDAEFLIIAEKEKIFGFYS